MADDEKAPETNVVSFTLAGKRYDIDLFDIDGVEWRDIKRVTNGMTAIEMTRAAFMRDDMEAVGALLWIWRRRNDRKLTYDDVLRGLRLRDFGRVEDSEEPENPPA